MLMKSEWQRQQIFAGNLRDQAGSLTLYNTLIFQGERQ